MSFFENCSAHYSIEKDFLNCTNTTKQCDLIVSMNNIQLIVKILDFYIPICLFIIGAILNIHCFTLTFSLFLRLGEVSRKRYVFVLCRCISSIGAAISMLLIRCFVSDFALPNISSYFLFFILIFFNNISFYSLLGAHIGNAVILYLGVKNPIFYNKTLGLIHIYWVAILNVIFSGIISLPFAFYQAGNVVGNGPIECNSLTCSEILSWCSIAIIFGTCVVTMLIQSFVLISICLNNRKIRKHGHFSSSSTVKQAQKRIACALFIILFISTSEAIFASILIGVENDNVLETCRNFYEADTLLLASISNLAGNIIFAIVVIIDPIFNIIFDRNITNQIGQQIKWIKLNFCNSETTRL